MPPQQPSREQTREKPKSPYLFVLTVPGKPPTINNSRMLCKGRLVKAPATTRYVERVKQVFKQKYHDVKIPFGKQKYYVKIFYYWSRVESSDVDNFAKHILDALNGLAWKDDRFIYKLFSEKKEILDGDEKTIIKIKKI